ncbi:MAG: hypothetical protein A2X61_03630 [Ignavibacteria bacterium GWB2_35_12]|nr:MAG: hypothetical protein A2X61_03630 [Ignavibacteria bacterium GWB2_35_12]OGU92169.1 MAG: hypothetical protein A2220_13570 [Ignavibacteria bacterium RIFOXYA2_FULL_35_10]OGV22512.1 MAG: hypothetical protein A2475_03305 [Ignavibacteria bacterium RIFOXYC2_FULL_35_21]
MQTLEKILDDIMALESDEKILISDILNKRRIEEERQQIAFLAKDSIQEYHAGKYKALSAEEGLEVLQLVISN